MMLSAVNQTVASLTSTYIYRATHTLLNADCSVVVVASIIDNFADYLQKTIQNYTNTRSGLIVRILYD